MPESCSDLETRAVAALDDTRCALGSPGLLRYYPARLRETDTLREASLIMLAQAVADGSDVDWEQARLRAASEEDRNAIQQLQELAKIGIAARKQVVSWGALELRGEIGSGTFGTVYRAWDTRLEREVALKLLHARHSGDPVASAVLKEGRLLARIRHPNVVTVYGADTFDGRVGIWMELVSGRTLKQVLEEIGPFGAHEAAVIGRDLCRALAAVHQQGFLHRDIKAQNVVREAGGRTVLMDFGAGMSARLEEEGPSPLIGTPVYLAPEILTGAPPTERSDIYSVGVLLYHLVSGAFPVTCRSLDELCDRHQRNLRVHLRDVRPDLPDAFVRAVDSATAVNPEDRPSSAGALEASLEIALGLRQSGPSMVTAGESPRRPSHLTRRAAFGAVTVAGFAATIWATGALGSRRRDSIAIVPFRNLTDKGADEFFSMGVADDITSNLARLGGLRIISVSGVASHEKAATQLAAELDVDTILDGSVRWSEGDRVRVVSRLVDGRTGETIWSESFDRRVGSFDTTVLSIQSEVSRKIAVSLKGELSEAEASRLLARPRDAARSYYDAGRYHWGLRTSESLARAIEVFERALDVDPSYGPAYSGLADSYAVLGSLDIKLREEVYPKAREHALKAVALDNTLAEAHASLGSVQKHYLEWRAAEESFERALQLKPEFGTAHHWYGVLLTQQGRFGAAIAQLKTAISLDPSSIAALGQFAATLLLARRYDEAITQADRVIEIDPRHPTPYQLKAEAYAHKGDYNLALAEMARRAEVSEVGAADQNAQGTLGYILAMAGRKDKALAILVALDARERNGEPVAAAMATICGALGRLDDAFDLLAKARARGEFEMGYLMVDPRWDPLRGDHRFGEMLASLGFADR